MNDYSKAMKWIILCAQNINIFVSELIKNLTYQIMAGLITVKFPTFDNHFNLIVFPSPTKVI